MEIILRRATAEAIGLKKFNPWCENEASWKWDASKIISLAALDKKGLDALEKVFIAAPRSTAGVTAILRDITTWRQTLDGRDRVKPRTVKQLCPLLTRYLAKSAGHRVYSKYDSDRDLWLAYYVNEIEFHEARRNGRRRRPAFVHMKLIYETFGGRTEKKVYFESEDCIGMTVPEALARQGYYGETKSLRDAYLEQMKKFSEIVPRVGTQFTADGVGTDDLDGNPKQEDSWYWRKTNKYPLRGARLVVDVFKEDPETENEDRDRREKVSVDAYFWLRNPNGRDEDSDDDDDAAAEQDRPIIEIPVHPFVATFDLKRHLRLQVHTDYLEEYKYDKSISEKLVLEPKLKSLVHLLVHHRGQAFRDIIGGKSGGAIVLLAGASGTGKTLTAEVYAETEGRALYSVQCSQLGTDPSAIEDQLHKVFARAQRWNAVTLLDEADVYVHERGDDLQQNAIVGVFLRVLEYHDTVLFLTTNRPEDVDDAIASRCIARLIYVAPTEEQQREIWRVLADASKIELDAATTKKIAASNHGATGRDVKNLLKLAHLLADAEKRKITAQDVEFVKQFKPTGKQTKEER